MKRLLSNQQLDLLLGQAPIKFGWHLPDKRPF